MSPSEEKRKIVSGQRRSYKRMRRKVSRRRQRPTREISAGGFVFKQTEEGLFFAMMKDSYGKWTFPKGHVEPGETMEEAAARETMEELGLDQIQLLEPLGQIAIWFRDRFVRKGALVHKDIHYFLFLAPVGANLFPQASEHIQEAAWIPLREVSQKSFYPDLKPIIRQALMRVRTYGKKE